MSETIIVVEVDNPEIIEVHVQGPQGASSGGSGGGGDLGTDITSTDVTITNTGGDDATIPRASDTEAGVMAAEDKTILGQLATASLNQSTEITIIQGRLDVQRAELDQLALDLAALESATNTNTQDIASNLQLITNNTQAIAAMQAALILMQSNLDDMQDDVDDVVAAMASMSETITLSNAEDYLGYFKNYGDSEMRRLQVGTQGIYELMPTLWETPLPVYALGEDWVDQGDYAADEREPYGTLRFANWTADEPVIVEAANTSYIMPVNTTVELGFTVEDTIMDKPVILGFYIHSKDTVGLEITFACVTTGQSEAIIIPDTSTTWEFQGSAVIPFGSPEATSLDFTISATAGTGEIGIETIYAEVDPITEDGYDPAAKIQVNSTSHGIGFPRMSTAQRLAMPMTYPGLVVYDYEVEELCITKQRINGSLIWKKIQAKAIDGEI